MAMCQAAKEAAWLTGLLEDFRLDLWSTLVILGDNQVRSRSHNTRSSTHARSISPSGTISPASLFKQDNSSSNIFQQKSMVDDALTTSLPPS